jgi:hypothetical protein
MDKYKKKAPKCGTRCGTRYAYSLYYLLFILNLTILVWNPDTIPFLLVSVGLRLPFGIYKAIKTADDELLNTYIRYLILYSVALGILGVAMNFYGFINPCSQYAAADDPCKNTNIFESKKYTDSNITAACNTFGISTGESVVARQCREAWFVRTATLLLCSAIFFSLSVVGLYSNLILDKKEKEQLDDGTDNSQEKYDLSEFSWAHNNVFPQNILMPHT